MSDWREVRKRLLDFAAKSAGNARPEMAVLYQEAAVAIKAAYVQGLLDASVYVTRRGLARDLANRIKAIDMGEVEP